MQKILRGPMIYVLLLLVVVWVVITLPTDEDKKSEINYSEFLTMVEASQVDRVAITAYEIVGLKKNSAIGADRFPGRYDFKVQGANNIERIYSDLDKIAASQTGKDAASVTAADYSFVLINRPIPGLPWYEVWGPYILLIACVGVLMYFFVRQQNGGNNKAMNFGRSRARLHTDDKKKITFAMVAGADEEKEELQEIVEFLKDPHRFAAMGARIPKGILLVGPPGTGKTYLSKAVAGEAGVPFFSISGSDFVEMFVGVGASRVRDLFDQAKKHAPSIVFIDEIDAVGRHRGAGMGGGHDEREQTLNQLLVEMDGFTTNEGVIILAATNRPDILDPALLRPGRFDRQITVNLPDIKGREEVLQVHAVGKPLGEDVDLKVLAKRTHYFSPADLENVMNEAALLAARRKKPKINMTEFVEAITRVQMGPEKRSRVITDKDKNLVAYHEAGHAVVLHYLEHLDEVHEVSIIPRGRAGGYTMALPGEDEYFISKTKLQEQIAMCMGGNAAEALALGDITTGSTSDLRHASDIARRMIMEYGMNDKIGRMYLGGDQEVFLGRDYGHGRNYSEEMAASIDEEIQRMMDAGFAKATQLLTLHRDKLTLIADQLLEHEKLSGDEFRQLINTGRLELPEAQAEQSASPGDADPTPA